MDNQKQLNNLIDQLHYAKDSVRELLDNPDALIDMKGIEYWAGEVNRLNIKIKELF